MKTTRFKFKLIVGGIIAAIVPLTVVGLFSVIKASNALFDTGQAGVERTAGNLAEMAELYLKQEVKFARSLAGSPLVVPAVLQANKEGTKSALDDLKKLDQLLHGVYKEIGECYELFILTDQNGVVVADSANGVMREKKVSTADRAYFQTARKGKLNISSPVKSKSTGKPVCVVAVSLKTPSGEFLGCWPLY